MTYKEAVKREVERKLASPLAAEIFNPYYLRGRKKLAWLIERHGSLEGERLQPYYLADIIYTTMSVSALAGGWET